MSETTGKEALLGHLRDAGVSVVIVNRIEELLGGEPFKGDLERFCGASHGDISAAYVATHPNAKLKGVGQNTFDAFDLFVRLWKQSRFEVKQLARATVEAQEARAAEKEAMRLELLDREVEFDAVTSAMAALETLGVRKCTLGRLLDLYDVAKAAKEASA